MLMVDELEITMAVVLFMVNIQIETQARGKRERESDNVLAFLKYEHTPNNDKHHQM